MTVPIGEVHGREPNDRYPEADIHIVIYELRVGIYHYRRH